MSRSIRWLFLASVLIPLSAYPAPAQEHGPHGRLGTVQFENSCAAGVQPELQSAFAMLHSFRYGPGEQAFRAVLARDPGCVIAQWGIASILMGNPIAGAGPSAQWAERARAALDQARRSGGGTERERDYLTAVEAYWKDWAARPERTRQQDRARAYEALASKYPADDEAQIFAALYLTATQSLADQTYSTYLRAAAVLERQFEKHPDHPGLAHYLIHSYDAPPIAERGLGAARRYADIAPAAPHALHMPSHVFTRVGAWKESFETNARSAAAARQDRAFEEQLHATDYQVYAALQLGRDSAARALVEQVTGVDGGGAGLAEHTGTGLAANYALAAIPARFALERGDWAAAAALPVRASPMAFAPALTRLARGLGSARTGNPDGAAREAAALAGIRDSLRAQGNEYWSGEAEIARMLVAGWAELARGNRDEALRLVRAAADQEDRTEKHIVTPGRLVPARELLGDLLLELNRPVEALEAYRASHRREPGRFRGLYGAARAAEVAGDRAGAGKYYRELLELVGEGSARPEATRARAFLAAAGR